jgi:hypothetical protein
MLGFNPKSETKNFKCLSVGAMGVIACIKKIVISLDFSQERVALYQIADPVMILSY